MSLTTGNPALHPDPAGGDATLSPRSVSATRSRADNWYRGVIMTVALAAFVVLFLIGLFLLIRGLGVLNHESLWTFLTSTAFQPTGAHPKVGVVALLYWTVVIGLIALHRRRADRDRDGAVHHRVRTRCVFAVSSSRSSTCWPSSRR